MKSTPPLPIDDVIDLAAREMTEVAAVDLTARVVERLQPRRPASIGVQLAAASTLAAAATLMLVLWWPRTLPPAGSITPGSSLATTTRDADPELAPLIEQRGAQRIQRARGTSPEETAWLARTIPALEPAAPISIESIQPTRPSIAPITVEAFGPQPIDVPPIDVRNAGGR